MERLDLKQLMRNHDGEYQDNTEGIRKLKHSDLILADIRTMETLKTEFSNMRKENPDEFASLCQRKCSFLYNSYTDIFNRLYKDVLDVKLMADALATLKRIENGEINQQEGSVQMGQLFYKVFVSSAVQAEEEHRRTEEEARVSETTSVQDGNVNSGKEIGWNEFKRTHLGYHPGSDNGDGRTHKKKNGSTKGKGKGGKKK